MTNLIPEEPVTSETILYTYVEVGDTILHYCSGVLVEATVESVTEHEITTVHEPVRWGNDFYSKTTLFNQYGSKPVVPRTHFKGKRLIGSKW